MGGLLAGRRVGLRGDEKSPEKGSLRSDEEAKEMIVLIGIRTGWLRISLGGNWSCSSDI